MRILAKVGTQSLSELWVDGRYRCWRDDIIPIRRQLGGRKELAHVDKVVVAEGRAVLYFLSLI